MRRFSPTQPCEKCGSTIKSVEFRSERQMTSPYLNLNQGMSISPAPSLEVLIVSCRICGFVDKFMPLDAAYNLDNPPAPLKSLTPSDPWFDKS